MAALPRCAEPEIHDGHSHSDSLAAHGKESIRGAGCNAGKIVTEIAGYFIREDDGSRILVMKDE
ncbi:hypothetical protein W02_14830 [Nitrospira sp. KM1]|nr:hypothetical protein W02_14830 [Nitrospira sp. KM1]